MKNSEKLQDHLYFLFARLQAVKVANRLKEKGYMDLIKFTNEIMAIHNKLSELSATERKVMSYIYIQLYKFNDSMEVELDNAPEGSEGVVVKVK